MTARVSLPGMRAPSAGFEQPFELLGACHERVERTLALLQRLRAYVQSPGCDDSARQAARDVLRYFDIAAPLHHEDEELHVFPPLLARAQAVAAGDAPGTDAAGVASEAAAVAAIVRGLQRDHVAMGGAWAVARVPLQDLADGRIDTFTPAQEAAFVQFAGLYDDHLRQEDRIVYPAARAALAPQAAQQMGRDMARRRGAG